jgi:membrane-associated phospholipid phosphatase
LETQLRTAYQGRSTRQEIARFLVEAVLLVGAMLVYWLLRGAVPERIAESFSRASNIIRLEERLGIFVEPRWQESIIDNLAFVKIANWIYLWAHLPVLIGGGIWLYVRNRERYRVYRNALLISAVIGLLVYEFFPVAPPRLLPEWGFVDTVALLNPENYNLQPGFLVNHYAAVPSLHVGWALLVGIALFDVDHRVPVRVFAVLLPLAMFFSVVLTANHFIFDIIVGAVIVLAAIAVAFVMENHRLEVLRLRRQQT